VIEVDLTWARLCAIVWLVFWRSIVGGGILGAIAGFIVGVISALAGIPGPHPISAGLAGLAATIPWYFIVFRMTLKKQYRGFRIALIGT